MARQLSKAKKYWNVLLRLGDADDREIAKIMNHKTLEDVTKAAIKFRDKHGYYGLIDCDDFLTELEKLKL